jgi:hypothetical protein
MSDKRRPTSDKRGAAAGAGGLEMWLVARGSAMVTGINSD